jgi:hypothetical protein
MKNSREVLPLEAIERRIYLIRDQKVMLDQDLAELYGVPTKVLNQAVSRNRDRFPADFMFRLTTQEFSNLKSQIVTASWGGRRSPPSAFTEQGVAMLSGVLRSKRAVRANVAIMRAFVRMREAMISHREMARKLNEMERKYDAQFRAVFDALRELMLPPKTPKRRPIGFIHPKDDDESS